MRFLPLIALLLLSGCDLFAPAVTYQADFFECGEPPPTLYICVSGTGPPRQDCTANGSGTTTTKPTIC